MSCRPFSRPIVLAMLLAAASVCSTCSSQHAAEPVEFRIATQIALDWNRLLLELERYTDGYRPPVSARMYAYVEMAAYESGLPVMNGYGSLESIYPSFHKSTIDLQNYHLPSALNAAFARIVRDFFPTAPPECLNKIQQLETNYAQLLEESADPVSIIKSIEFGRATASAVWAYSMQDSIGHDAFLYNFDRSFKCKPEKGCWKMDEERPMPALLPNWGKVRPFVVRPSEMIAKPPIPYNESVPSDYFSGAMEVFSISNSLSPEDLWIAEFWSDDIPGLTMTPTGRWISIASQAIEKSGVTFPEAMETYLKTAMAICDAAIVCWDNKYRYQVERPETFIRRHIQPDWAPHLHSNPPFPGYPSGHAIFGAAAAAVLSEVFGSDFSMVDRTHKNRNEFNGKPREFESFDAMANENAYSRVLIGVHFRMDCEEGLRLGKLIGQKVASLPLRNATAAVIRQK